MERRYEVPEALRTAAARGVHAKCGSVEYHPQIRIALEIAVRWIAENPLEPNIDQLQQLRSIGHAVDGQYKSETTTLFSVAAMVMQWQRQMFLAPEPKTYNEVFDLTLPKGNYTLSDEQINYAVNEAFRRGMAVRKL